MTVRAKPRAVQSTAHTTLSEDAIRLRDTQDAIDDIHETAKALKGLEQITRQYQCSDRNLWLENLERENLAELLRLLSDSFEIKVQKAMSVAKGQV